MLEPRPDPMIARDLVGYGEHPPDPAWPGGAAIAVNFNINVEGGGERTLANGDKVSESVLNDIGTGSYEGVRVPLVELIFEYGSRRGIWRLLDLFQEFSIHVSILAVARAIEQNLPMAKAFVDRGHEIVSHGYRWIDYCLVPEEIERDHVRRAIEVLTRVSGARPVGWMTGRPGPNTRRLLVEAGGFLYDRDLLNDEIPYWLTVSGKPHLVIPYSFETNDNRFNEKLRLRHQRRLLHLHARRVRCPAPRRPCGFPQAIVDRAARSLDRATGPRSGSAQTPRIHARVR